MHNADMPLPDPEESLFYRTDEEFAKLWADTGLSTAPYRGNGSRHRRAICRGEGARRATEGQLKTDQGT